MSLFFLCGREKVSWSSSLHFFFSFFRRLSLSLSLSRREGELLAASLSFAAFFVIFLARTEETERERSSTPKKERERGGKVSSLSRVFLSFLSPADKPNQEPKPFAKKGKKHGPLSEVALLLQQKAPPPPPAGVARRVRLRCVLLDLFGCVSLFGGREKREKGLRAFLFFPFRTKPRRKKERLAVSSRASTHTKKSGLSFPLLSLAGFNKSTPRASFFCSGVTKNKQRRRSL